jgi:hypothetical protein
VRRKELPFGRSFDRSFVRWLVCQSGGKENDNGGKKVMTRGRRSKIKDEHRKSSYAKSGIEIQSVCKLLNASSSNLDNGSSRLYSYRRPKGL